MKRSRVKFADEVPQLSTSTPARNRSITRRSGPVTPALSRDSVRRSSPDREFRCGATRIGANQRVSASSSPGLTSPLEIGPRQSADKPLAVAVMPDVLGLGDLKCLVEPAVGQRTFRLLDSQDQHDKAPSRCERR